MSMILLGIAVIGGLFLGLAVILTIAEKTLTNYGICNVSINKGESVIEIEGGGTLLSALYENKIFIPSACGGKGSCGYCKLTVNNGGGPVLPTETPYMTRGEVRSGTRLACQVKVKSNMDVQIPEELLNVKEFRSRVSLARMLTHDIRELNFELIEPTEISQRPGQYVQILAPQPGGGVFRAYSISSPSYDTGKVQLDVRLVPGGIASTYLHELQEGDEVIFTGPFGEFRISEDPSVPLVCVGGGCGMAPMANIIFTLYDRWPERECHLFFGCRTTDDVFYLEEFKELAKKHPNLTVTYALSDPLPPEQSWDGETGFIHISVDRLLEPGRRQAFLCGPPPMIDAVTEVLEEKGLAPEDIFYDKF